MLPTSPGVNIELSLVYCCAKVTMAASMKVRHDSFLDHLTYRIVLLLAACFLNLCRLLSCIKDLEHQARADGSRAYNSLPAERGLPAH